MSALYRLILFSHLFILISCHNSGKSELKYPHDRPYVIVLGIAQDAGFPQANCQKECCNDKWNNPEARRMVSCIGLVDPSNGQTWMIDATPDFKYQLYRLLNHSDKRMKLSGIAITHAHIGHYTGLMQLGREVMGAKDISVHVMPRMKTFLELNGPWSQLVELQNIKLKRLKQDSTIILSENLSIQPILVPHRDEFSETVGYKVMSKEKTLLFVPDIDKWSKWSRSLTDEVAQNDYLLIDGSFFQEGEIPGRDMSEIPHPFVVETMDLLKDIPSHDKSKVKFIHLNHTNPLFNKQAKAYQSVREFGADVCQELEFFIL